MPQAPKTERRRPVGAAGSEKIENSGKLGRDQNCRDRDGRDRNGRGGMTIEIRSRLVQIQGGAS